MEVSTLTKGILAGATFMAAVGGLYSYSADAFNHLHEDFVTVGSLNDAFLQKDVREAKKMIRRLESKQQYEGLSEREKFDLEQLHNDLEAMQ